MAKKRLEPDIPEYFWSKVDVRGENECWEWKGRLSRKGYGTITFKGSQKTVQRVAFYFKNQRFPEGDTHHTCHNKKCCNPAHLVELSVVEHSKLTQSERTPSTFPKPENSRTAKLTWEKVAEIRQLRKDGWELKPIGDKYGVTRQQVSSIVLYKDWKNPPPTNF